MHIKRLKDDDLPGIFWHKISHTNQDIEAALVEVTPRLAQSFLDRMRKNRRPHIHNISRLVDGIKNQWILTGEALIFDRQGRMLDGGHRCQACITAGMSFLTVLIRGIDEAAFDRIDTGTKRTAGDVFLMEGMDHYTTLIGATTALMMSYKQTNIWWERPSFSASPHDIRKYLTTLPGLIECAPLAHSLNNAVGQPTSIWLAAYYLTRRLDKELAVTFFTKVVTGKMLDIGDPAYTLRMKMLEYAKSEKIKISRQQLAAFIVNSWNAARKGRSLKILRGLTADAGVPDFI